MPQGSFLLWLTLPDHIDSEKIYQQAKPEGISILPGTIFGTSDQFRHCIRFSCSNLLTNMDWKQGVAKLACFIHSHLTSTQTWKAQ
jgi:DNA-binding transcriptional MocR family regulator